MEKIYTSEEILEMEDLYEIQEIGTIKYYITKDEWQWQQFIDGKYCIADYVFDNTEEDENEILVLTIDSEEMSKALDDDNYGWGKATMLSDDTALQKIFFWLYTETER